MHPAPGSSSPSTATSARGPRGCRPTTRHGCEAINASGQKPSGRTICHSRANAPNTAAASRTPWRRPGDARWTASRRRA
eukprot:8919544-Alexandrium_andersonii.AAC.1